QQRPRGHGDRVRPRGTQPSRYDPGQVHPGPADRAAPGAPRAVAGRGGRPMSTLLPTSIVGSLPKPSQLSEPETRWSPWRLQRAARGEGRRDALHPAASEQTVAGLDVISDGEQTRQHFVTPFIEHLSGVDFARRETVRIRDRYDASVPTVVG